MSVESSGRQKSRLCWDVGMNFDGSKFELFSISDIDLQIVSDVNKLSEFARRDTSFIQLPSWNIRTGIP